MTGTRKRRLLYLPIETKARELLGKSFLAARAVERGWIVILGAQKDVRAFMRGKPAGVYVEMSIPDRKIARLEEIRRDGHRVANLCEESAFYTNPEDYCARKLGAGALALTDVLLTAGARNARDVRDHRPASEGKIAITGNPRFDVLLPELRGVFAQEAETIKRELGSFLLVNSNFVRVNAFGRDKDTIDQWLEKGRIHEGGEADFLREHAEFKRRQMAGLKALLAELASIPDAGRIVFRPHPAEDRAMWRAWAEPLGIEVRHDGAANAWMMAADAVLHPGCTTGIEGLLLDRPVFSYVPEPESAFINEPDRISQWVNSAREVILGVDDVRGLGRDALRATFAPQRERLHDYIANMEPPFASDRVLDAIAAFDLPEVTEEQAGVAGSGLARLARTIMARAAGTLRASQSLRGRQKLGEIDGDDIASPLRTWVAAGALGELPKLTRFSSQLWAIH